MRNGQGDYYLALFNSAGCLLKGFAHEAAMSPFANQPPVVAPRMFDAIPAEFASLVSEPAFAVHETTFCIWRRHTDDSWRRGNPTLPPGIADPDGSAGLLRFLDGRPETYASWAREYFERDVPLKGVARIYALERFDRAILQKLNSEAPFAELASEASQIGYPSREHA
jgi:hypothetical protein